jgi:hypothetical protein
MGASTAHFGTAAVAGQTDGFRLGDDRFWDGFTVPPGARVTAQSPDPNVIDLFVTGRDNRVIRRS